MMGTLDFYVRVLKTLDEIGAPYMIVGAYGGSVFGIARSTNDIDMLVDLQEKDCYAISGKFPLPRYYADPEMIKNSIQMGIMFNLIDTEEGARADLVPLKREPEYQLAFNRRVKETFQSPSGESFEAWVAQEAARIGRETLDMWNKSLAKAKQEIEKGDTPRKW